MYVSGAPLVYKILPCIDTSDKSGIKCCVCINVVVTHVTYIGCIAEWAITMDAAFRTLSTVEPDSCIVDCSPKLAILQVRMLEYELYVSCMYLVCILYVSCMYLVCILYVSCMYLVCILYVSCMYLVCLSDWRNLARNRQAYVLTHPFAT